MNTQTSLSNLMDWYTTMLQVIQSLSNEEIQSTLKTILERGKLHVEALSRNPDDLKQEIDQYLQNNNPFEWNKNPPPNSKEERVEKDWEQHDNLTLFAMLLGNKELLKKWGVDYPLGLNGPGLADASKEYINVLIDVMSKCEVATQKQYYDYLINQLKAHPTMKK
jgi:ribosomal protein L11 methylase PrmA